MLVYQILNTVTKKRYIGQTLFNSLKKRQDEHIAALNRGNHHNKHLQRAWMKNGPDAFEFSIIARCESSEELNETETRLIEEGRTQDRKHGYNIMSGGSKHNQYEVRMRTSKTMHPKEYPEVVDPQGNVHRFDILRDFVRVHDLLQPPFWEMMHGKTFHYKGWRLATPETNGVPFNDDDFVKRGVRISQARRPNGFPNVISPDGTMYTVEHLSRFCEEHQLSKGCLSELLNGKKINYKGWIVQPDRS